MGTASVPDRWRARGGTGAVALFDMLDGLRPVTNILGVGDPDVHKIDGQWTMFLGGFTTRLRVSLVTATLPRGATLSSTDWALVTEPGRPRRALRLTPDPPRGQWDSSGMHTPSYVAGGQLAPAGRTGGSTTQAAPPAPTPARPAGTRSAWYAPGQRDGNTTDHPCTSAPKRDRACSSRWSATTTGGGGCGTCRRSARPAAASYPTTRSNTCTTRTGSRAGATPECCSPPKTATSTTPSSTSAIATRWRSPKARTSTAPPTTRRRASGGCKLTGHTGVVNAAGSGPPARWQHAAGLRRR